MPRSYILSLVLISADARQACTLFLSGVPHLQPSFLTDVFSSWKLPFPSRYSVQRATAPPGCSDWRRAGLPQMNKSKSAFVGRLNELQKNDGGDAASMADNQEAITPSTNHHDQRLFCSSLYGAWICFFHSVAAIQHPNVRQ